MKFLIEQTCYQPTDQQVLEKCREIFGVWAESLAAAISVKKTDNTIIQKYRIYHHFLATAKLVQKMTLNNFLTKNRDLSIQLFVCVV